MGAQEATFGLGLALVVDGGYEVMGHVLLDHVLDWRVIAVNEQRRQGEGDDADGQTVVFIGVVDIGISIYEW